MGKNRPSKSLYTKLLSITLIPVFLLMILVILFGVRSFTKVLENEVKHGLMDLSTTIVAMYDNLYPGDYSVITKDNQLYMLKGEHVLNGDFSIIDSIKENTAADVTLYYQDVRLITTVENEDHVRMVGTTVSPIVKRDVLETGNAQFYPSVKIGKDKFFAYYAPLKNEDGTMVGMIFVAKPVAAVHEMIQKAIIPIVAAGVIAMLVIGFLIIRFSNELMLAIKKMEEFLEKVAKGDLNENLDYLVTKREDELSELGKHALHMQKSLRDLVEKDALTGLINRRSADKKLKGLQKEQEEYHVSYCLAIGDIDFFKKVNDTYGHEWGDEVLIKVAEILKRNFIGKGFVARWGGEEFLMAFAEQSLEESEALLQKILEEIRKLEIPYDEHTMIRVTMSFGICMAEGTDIDAVIREADGRLYYAKEHGRNQIFSHALE